MLIALMISLSTAIMPMMAVVAATATQITAYTSSSVLLSVFMRNLGSRFMCGALFSPIVWGIMARWIVAKVVLSESFVNYIIWPAISTLSLPVTATAYLTAITRGKKFTNPVDAMIKTVRGWHEDSGWAADAVYIFAFFALSNILQMTQVAVCSATTVISDVSNIGQVGVETSSSYVYAAWNWVSQKTSYIVQTVTGGGTVQSTEAVRKMLQEAEAVSNSVGTAMDNAKLLEFLQKGLMTANELRVWGINNVFAIFDKAVDLLGASPYWLTFIGSLTEWMTNAFNAHYRTKLDKMLRGTASGARKLIEAEFGELVRMDELREKHREEMDRTKVPIDTSEEIRFDEEGARPLTPEKVEKLQRTMQVVLQDVQKQISPVFMNETEALGKPLELLQEQTPAISLSVVASGSTKDA